MREITKEVLDGTYPKILGRGVLDWRIMKLEPTETKHIVEAGEWRIYLRRDRITENAVIVSIDKIKPEAQPLKGLPESIDANVVYAHSCQLDDPLLIACGLTLSGVRYRVEPAEGEVAPPNMKEDCLLSKEEMDSFMAASERDDTLKASMEKYALGAAKFHRVDYGGNRSAVLLVGEQDGFLSLLTYYTEDFQGMMYVADMFHYLCTRSLRGGEYVVSANNYRNPTDVIRTLETHKCRNVGVYMIEKGASNAS